MLRFQFVLPAALWACLTCANTEAGILSSHLVDGENKLVDESRELFIKGSGNLGPGIEGGDILIGFARIDEVLPDNSISPNSAYAIFSQTFAATPTPIGTIGTNAPGYSFDFVPTTQAGLTLSDLLGVAAPAALDPTGMVAILSGSSSPFSSDLTIDSPGDVNGDTTVDIFDSFALLTGEGEVDAVFGLTSNIGDFFNGNTSFNLAPNQDFVADLGNLANISDPNTTLANFTGFLSLVYDLPDNAVITSGANVLSGSVTLPGVSQNPDDAFTFVNKADFVFDAQIVPEPGSLAVWAILGVAGGIVARRKKARKTCNA